MRSSAPLLTILATCACLAVLGMPVVRGDTTSGEVLSAYSILAPTSRGGQVTIARVILQGAASACPKLVPAIGDGAAIPTQARANPDPAHFDIQVCEAVVTTAMQVQGRDRRLPGPPDAAAHLAVIGDSGCRPGSQGGCQPGSSAWPLLDIANAAARADPDIVLHMGDYNYRGTPGKVAINGKRGHVYDAGDNTDSVGCTLAGPYLGQNSPGSDQPDQWMNWWLDFFQPATELLAAAPWIVARGNHELCSRAGPGWFYLLDPGSDLPGVATGQGACPPAESAEPHVFGRPYRLDLAGLSIVVMDSANACDRGSLHQGHFDRQFQALRTLVDATPAQSPRWLLTHRPIWAVRAADASTAPSTTDPSGQFALINQTLQTSDQRHPVAGAFDLVLSGHLHTFEAIGRTRDGLPAGPDQLIIGNSGIELDPGQDRMPFSFAVGQTGWAGLGLHAFGYMELRPRGEAGWTGRLLDPEGKTLATCGSDHPARKAGPCAPAD
ncbi:hypothetical protein CKO23_19305 [Thiocystis violacea]|nr:hypothetical protein [Thiocystis violacea]